MYDHVVVDVEIQKTIEETEGGWNATDKLGVAVACVWQYSDQRMRVYGPDDKVKLMDRLLSADRISGYNILNFDFPVIFGVSKQNWIDGVHSETLISDPDGITKTLQWIKSKLLVKTDDMLRRIWQAQGLDPDKFAPKTHGGTSLDAVALATLGSRKIGHGADAPIWYQQGLVQKVVNYCSDDVALERDLTDFVERYGYVIVKGQQLSIPKWKGGN